MRIPRFIGPRRRREKGIITIEMALAMPVLLFMIAGIIDLSLLFWEKHVITNATREGARYAAKFEEPPSSTQVKNTVVQPYIDKFSLKNLDGSRLVLSNGTTFSYTFETTGTGKVVTVKLNQIPYKMMLLPNIKTLFGEARTSGDDAFYLSAQTSMLVQSPGP